MRGGLDGVAGGGGRVVGGCVKNSAGGGYIVGLGGGGEKSEGLGVGDQAGLVAGCGGTVGEEGVGKAKGEDVKGDASPGEVLNSTQQG